MQAAGNAIDVTVQCETATVVFGAIPRDVQAEPPALGLFFKREECAKDVFVVFLRDSASVILVCDGQWIHFQRDRNAWL